MLQKQVYTNMAKGVAGQQAVPGQAVYTTVNYIAGEGVHTGKFAFATADENIAAGSGERVLGLVERVVGGFITDIYCEGSMEIPEGAALTIAREGDFLVETKEDCAAGGIVFADKSNGDVLTNSGQNAVPSGWQFANGGKAGDIVAIFNAGGVVFNNASGGTETVPGITFEENK